MIRRLSDVAFYVAAMSMQPLLLSEKEEACISNKRSWVIKVIPLCGQ
ncbi:Uncharacterised protein [Zhongshania aliphaticivorans]|uniref:Uncharacterized protein n=1 Tax=Zhongshania aliphaticivorans TaxID=1470434 RepID=A0A5S9MWI8_9GAMM|nr:Uncharacterised protein [Zhongshania aliphaticivorans]CAA0084651.1 Uncharacterised protein [Zhongshania aliphaticivorans]